MPPRSLDEVEGPAEVVGANGFLSRAIAEDRVPSLVFWGLDAYYLRQERLFRLLYDAVRRGEPGVERFSMETGGFRAAVDSWWRTVWTMTLLPFYGAVILAGLAGIPREVEDAAAVDGATGWRKMAYVTIPLVLPVMTIALLFGIVFTATDMVIVYLLANNGGPFNSTHMITTWAFTTGILTGALGDGAAVSLYLFPVLMLVTVLMLWFARRAEVT